MYELTCSFFEQQKYSANAKMWGSEEKDFMSSD